MRFSFAVVGMIQFLPVGTGENVLALNADLNVVCRLELTVPHMILFHPHKGRVEVGFGIAFPAAEYR